jgi:ribosomal-protein-serine acetyltransferase
MEQYAASEATELIVRLEDQTELRSVDPVEAEDFFAMVDRNRCRLHRWLAWTGMDYSLEDTRRFLTERAAELENRQSLTMTIRHGGTLCGAIGLHRIDERHRNTSIGYWIDREFEGKGIVTAACRAIVTEGFSGFGLHRIEIRCATWNHRSSAVPRRLDFVEEGILREAEWVHDKWVDLRVFSMLAQDWTKQDGAGTERGM